MVIRLVYIFSIGLLLMGCQTRVAWREEVKLSTGEVIVIDREVEHKGGGGPWPHGQGTVPQHHLISFEYPPNSGNIIRWRSTKFDMPRASWAEFPLILDMNQDRNWYVFTMQWLNDVCIRYVKYQYQQNAWVESPISDSPIEGHETNLYLASASNSIDDYIDIKTKNYEYNSGTRRKIYLKTGPKQIIPVGNSVECHWNPVTQTVEAINTKGERK